MANRGRGRGRTVNLSGDQGVHRVDMLPPTVQPPPDYPTLENKPLPTMITGELRYMLQLKKDFAEYMHESQNAVLPPVEKKDIERYSDRYQDLMSDKQKYQSRYNWDRMPKELNSIKKKRTLKIQNGTASKKLKEMDVQKKLNELESKESLQQSDAEEEEEEEDEAGENNEEGEEENEEELDEEMDEGTDYVNNYFDNGENYEDDEDNLDDGAIF